MKSQAQNAFVERLLRNDSDTLYDMRTQIESLMAHPGWAFVMDLVEARIQDTQLVMETGLHLHPEYTAYIGEIRGMRTAQYAADAVIDAAERKEQSEREDLASREATHV